MIEILQNWDPFGDWSLVIDIFSKWRYCVENITKNQSEYEGYRSLDRKYLNFILSNLYEKIFRDLWLPRFSEALISFDMSQFAILLSNVSLWRPITSSHSWDLLCKIILACIIVKILIIDSN